ncbi:hypothetical protein [uncultured Dysgonomonas sp.]|uniref:Uncharacterized protein n=1 Tax=uncultured Dysgonomonas sp. TaxID=206096 RepID=A0A212IX18_9BACT|nr:hypothetical protein [uncultured Dysgonomonas sp.]SBV91771.1 hypothetical protein KL86DYS1_10427 [uncultured Dysgonomonas sp.]
MQEIKIPERCKASIDFDKRVVVIESEKFTPKKGDICVKRNKWIFIFSHTIQLFSPDAICYYVLISKMDDLIRFDKHGIGSLSDREEIRLATKSEQQLLLDALAKEGKKWNANTLQIENIENDILVPESIGIYRYNAPHEYGGGDNLFIGFNDNTQLLGYCADRWVAYPNIYNDNKKVQCKLTPCKREDLKNGDTAFISDTFRLDDSMLSDRGRYVKIIGDKAIKINKKGEPIYDNAFHNYWYKVEPVNK